MSLDLSPYDRDILIRTIIGEAANQGPEGWAAVAGTIRNRALDPRWPDTAADVALQPKQFSAWNKGEGGNSLPQKYGPGDAMYERVGKVADQVWSGQMPDPTGGAVYYYAPGGMPGGKAPKWWDAAVAERGGDVVTIGGHRFAGKVKGSAVPVDDVSIAAMKRQPTGTGSGAMAGSRIPPAQTTPPVLAGAGGIGSGRATSMRNDVDVPVPPTADVNLGGILQGLASAMPKPAAPAQMMPMGQGKLGASLVEFLASLRA